MTNTPFEIIQAERERQGIPAKRLCIDAGLNKDTLASAKRNGGRLANETAIKLCHALGLDPVKAIGQDNANKLGLAPAAPQTNTANPVRLIDIGELRTSSLNPRKTFDADGIDELAASIAVQGLLQNLVVRPTENVTSEGVLYTIVAGERRFRALEQLWRMGELPKDLQRGIPCKEVNGDEVEHMKLALLENLQRKDVNPMEEAHAFKQLMAMSGMKTKDISDEIGCSQRHIQQRLALVDRLVPEAQEALSKGEINFTQARAIGMADRSKQRALVKKPKELGSARDLQRDITGDMIRADYALFPLDQYLGEIVTADDGKQFCPDRQAFFAAQRAAAADLCRQAEANGKPWAAVSEGAYVPGYEYPEVMGDEVAGYLVHIDSINGKVATLEDRTRREDRQEYDKSPEKIAERKAIHEANERIAEEKDTFTGTVLAAIRTRPDIALKILLSDIGHNDVLKGGAHWCGDRPSVQDWRIRLTVDCPSADMLAEKAAENIDSYYCSRPMLIAAAEAMLIPVPAHVYEDGEQPADADDGGMEFDDAIQAGEAAQ